MNTRREHDAIYCHYYKNNSLWKRKEKNKQDKEVRRCYTKEKNGTYKAPNISARGDGNFPGFFRLVLCDLARSRDKLIPTWHHLAALPRSMAGKNGGSNRAISDLRQIARLFARLRVFFLFFFRIGHPSAERVFWEIGRKKRKKSAVLRWRGHVMLPPSLSSPSSNLGSDVQGALGRCLADYPLGILFRSPKVS
jgi:hypothetical protein